jgi:branched-chain amino acid transport system ATP-binding protein
MTTPLLAAHNLNRQFGGLMAVNDVSFRVHQGEILGLLGPNGAGKTTLFNLISGVTPVSAGRIEWRGVPITGMASHAVAGLGIARTFQNLRLFPTLSCLDNVMVGLHRHARQHRFAALFQTRPFHQKQAKLHREALTLLELFGLAEAADRPAHALSYGDRRRLEMARALANRPELLLLDEPAAGMNPHEKDQLCALIRQIQAQFQLTVLIIEHHVPLMMQLCDRLVVLNFGKTIAEGPPEQIAKDPAVIEAYLGGAE